MTDGSDVRSGPDYDHWLQGGPCNDLHIFAFVALPAEIHMLNVGDTWARVLPPWPEAVVYRREPGVEQFDRERIYYPASDITASSSEDRP